MMYKYNDEEYYVNMDDKGILVTSKKDPTKKGYAINRYDLFSKINKTIDQISLKPTEKGMKILKSLKELGCETFTIRDSLDWFVFDQVKREYINASSNILPKTITIETNWEFKFFERNKQYKIDEFIK